MVFILGVFFCPSNTIYSQSFSKLQSLIKEGGLNLEQADTIFLKQAIIDKDSTAYLYALYAHYLFNQKKEKNNALYYAEKGLKLVDEKDSLNLQRHYFSLGKYFYSLKRYTESISAFEKSISFNKSSPLNTQTTFELAYLFQLTNQHLKSISYWELVIKEALKNNNKKRLQTAYYYCAGAINQANDASQYKKGILYIQKADSLINEIKTSKRDFYAIKNTAAGLYNKNETLDILKAEKYLFETLERAKQEKDSNITATTYAILGNLHNGTNKNISLSYLNKSLALSIDNDTIGKVKNLTNIGYTYNYHNEFEFGLEKQMQSLQLLTKEKNLLASEYNDFRDPARLNSLRYLLPEIGETYLKRYTLEKNLEDLDKSLEFFAKADKIISLSQENNQEFQSRLFWRKLGSDLYNKAIKACYLKKDYEQAFYYTEKNKMLLLLQDLSIEKYRKKLEIPETIEQELKELKATIVTLEKKYLDKKNLKTQEQLLLKQRRLKHINDSLGIYKNIPQLDVHISSLKQTQESLADDEVKISYHVSSDDGFGIYSNKNNGYVMYITQNQVQLLEIPQLDVLKSAIQDLLDSYKTPNTRFNDVKKQVALSHSIYNQLFPTEIFRQLTAKKKLIISPDNFLSFLPFEALNMTSRQDSYLIKTSEIYYVPSHSFAQKKVKYITHKAPRFLAMAPIQFSDESLGPLHYSKNEIETLKNYYKGTAIVNEQATKNEFFSQIETNPFIIHLATHAGAKDEYDNPWIAFANEKMDTNELNLIKNDASLVFLSGCETNLGDIKTGEGVMSLARGFFYGGAQSVISSLWNIDDKSSSFIVDQFYKNLSKGKTKSAALHEAKLTYLNSSNLSEKSPHYWASLVLLGDHESISSYNNTLVYLVCAGILLFFIVFLLSKKKLIKSKSSKLIK